MSCIFLISDECPFTSIVLRYAGDVPGISCVVRGHPAVKILGQNSCVVYKIRKWLRNRAEIPSAVRRCPQRYFEQILTFIIIYKFSYYIR